ncbi:MAG TPA: GH116 family glycosyl hydrolase, partial [Chthonomonadaceae bacterium]|nr:GH116 family glycosyl hydrolase [Chthonomonadaceae bacterium]
ARPGWWEEFARAGTVSGEAPLGQEGKTHPAGVVAVRLTLKPNDYVVLPFAFAWHTPRYRTLSGADYGRAYAQIFPDSNRAARLLLAEWQSLLSLTQEWQNRLLFSDLPRWLVRRLINSAAPLTANSLYTRAGNFTLLANVGTLSGGDAVAASDLGAFGALSDRLAASRLLLAFFPELAAQELASYARAQSLTGAIPRSLGTLERPLGWQDPAEITASLPTPLDFLATLLHRRAFYAWPDDAESASAFVVQVAEYVLWTGDTSFLKPYYPYARLALRAILQRGLDSAGLPEGGSPATGTLWLAALRAGQRLAALAGDEDFAKECKDAATSAAEGVRKRFWNGAFYAMPGGGQALPADGFCQTDQLWGEWAADSLGLGPLLPPEEVRKALQSLQARNDRAAGTPFGPPYRVRSDGTLPPDDPEARQCRVAASLLAQAALYITQGQATAGVALLQRLENTRDNALRSPWETPAAFQADTGRSVTPGLAYMTGAADWNLLYALEGFTADLNAGRLSLAPNMPGTWRSLSAPLFAPTFWGTVTFRPTARGGVLTLRIDRLIPLAAIGPPDPKNSAASLVLQAVRIPGPPPRADSSVPGPPTAHVSLRRAPVGSRAALDPTGAVIVSFESPVTLFAGDHLEIDVH